eukprot:CAMPEP_0115061078 /NCGR_PEP_ID=MMETSP0227-20121206/7808_1 /TAXON_ID=89957 /ORGANISM="Polarella glacialis, Strain CCMP 1383" /LENGTH=351 /DNA_ID=CAMNT_0002446341 /DNA_START=96 /DNA_END=1151 /DNA_ORIENTATION=+
MAPSGVGASCGSFRPATPANGLREATKASGGPVQSLLAAMKTGRTSGVCGRENVPPVNGADPKRGATLGKTINDVHRAIKSTQGFLRSPRCSTGGVKPEEKRAKGLAVGDTSPSGLSSRFQPPARPRALGLDHEEEETWRARALRASRGHRHSVGGPPVAASLIPSMPCSPLSNCQSLRSTSSRGSPLDLSNCHNNPLDLSSNCHSSSHEVTSCGTGDTTPVARSSFRASTGGLGSRVRALSPEASSALAAVAVAQAAAAAACQVTAAAVERRGRLSAMSPSLREAPRTGMPAGSIVGRSLACDPEAACTRRASSLAQARIFHKTRVNAEERAKRFSISIRDRLSEVTEAF